MIFWIVGFCSYMDFNRVVKDSCVVVPFFQNLLVEAEEDSR